MAYIDKAFYDSMSSTAITTEEFASMAERASDIIDAITFRAVERFGLVEGDSAYTRVKKAVVYQMEFIQRTFGSLDAWENDAESSEGSETIGNYSYSRSSAGKQRANGLAVSPHLFGVLNPVIALGRRVG
jgi:hypothetical protein